MSEGSVEDRLTSGPEEWFKSEPLQVKECVCVCAFLWFQRGGFSQQYIQVVIAGGLKQIRDKLMPSAFCLLHALLQHNEPATQALIWQSRRKITWGR